MSAGNKGILCIAADNANNTTTNTPTSITDSAGNTWTRRINLMGGGGANATEEIALYDSTLTSNLTAAGNVDVTYTAANVTAKCWAFIEIAPSTTGNLILYHDFNQSAQATSGTPTVTVGTGNGLVNDVIIGMGAAESADTWVGVASPWSTKQSTGVGSGTSGMSIITQTQVQAAGGAATFNPTLTSVDCRIVIYSLREVSPKTRTNGESSTSEASTTITFREPLTSGSTAVLCWAGRNAVSGGGTPNLPAGPLTDSAGNSWTQRLNTLYDPGAANAGVEIGVYTSVLTNAIAIGATVAVGNYTTNVNNKAWTVYEFSDATAYANSGSSCSGCTSGQTSSTPSVTTGSITNGNYVIGLCGAEGDNQWSAGGDTDTTNGSWSSPDLAEPGTTAVTIISQYKRTTGGGAQTYNPTLAGSQDWHATWVELTAPALSTGNSNFFAFF